MPAHKMPRNNSNSSSTGEVIEGTRNVRRDLPYSASLIEASVTVYCRTSNAEILGAAVPAPVTPCQIRSSEGKKSWLCRESGSALTNSSM